MNPSYATHTHPLRALDITPAPSCLSSHFKGVVHQTTNAHHLVLKGYFMGSGHMQHKMLNQLLAAYSKRSAILAALILCQMRPSMPASLRHTQRSVTLLLHLGPYSINSTNPQAGAQYH